MQLSALFGAFALLATTASALELVLFPRDAEPELFDPDWAPLTPRPGLKSLQPDTSPFAALIGAASNLPDSTDDNGPALTSASPERRAFSSLTARYEKRQGCAAGYGPCKNDAGTCCPVGGDCCGGGNCCALGDWCYATGCCNRADAGCDQKVCFSGLLPCKVGVLIYTLVTIGLLSHRIAVLQRRLVLPRWVRIYPPLTPTDPSIDLFFVYSDNCVIVDGKLGCCLKGKTCTNGPPTCSSAGYVLCPSQEYCCRTLPSCLISLSFTLTTRRMRSGWRSLRPRLEQHPAVPQPVADQPSASSYNIDDDDDAPG